MPNAASAAARSRSMLKASPAPAMISSKEVMPLTQSVNHFFSKSHTMLLTRERYTRGWPWGSSPLFCQSVTSLLIHVTTNGKDHVGHLAQAHGKDG